MHCTTSKTNCPNRDRSPKHLEGLEERLVTRFSWGLTQHITPPEFETRIAILQSKTEHLDYHSKVTP